MCSRVLVPFHNHGLTLNSWGLEPKKSLFNDFSPFSLSPLSINNSLSIFDDAFLDIDHRFNQLKRGLDFTSFPRLDRDREAFGLNGEVVTEGNEKKFKLSVPLGDFPAEDVKVSLKDWIVTIEAKTEQNSEDGSSRSLRQVSRKFNIPRNLNMKEVTSTLTSEGVLKIEAPVPQKPAVEPRRDQAIPILLE